MKILFVDKNNFQTQTRRMLLEDMGHHTTELATSLEELKSKFKKGDFGLIIIDHAMSDEGQQCFDHIISQDSDQHVLVVSNAKKCVIPNCEDCATNYFVRRLNNPTPIPNILRMIGTFDLHDCDHYDPSTVS